MVLVVTGGIGSGKTSVCSILERSYGCRIYDADSRAKALYEEYPELMASIEAGLDCRISDVQGRLVPSLLADRIFRDRKALETVEGLLFPYLMKDFMRFSAAAVGHVVFESATILDKPYFNGLGDVVLIVDAPVHLRVDRACARDGSDAERVYDRIRNQNSRTSQINDGRKYYTIENDGTIEELEVKLAEVMESVIGKSQTIENR